MNKHLRELLADYKNSKYITEHELSLIEQFLQLMDQRPDCFGRVGAAPGEALAKKGHITASAWIINPENSAALLTHHKKLNKWLQLGGHCDGNPDVAATALREAQEESGMQTFEFIIPGVFDIDIHAIPNSCEYHYDIRFLLQAKDSNFIISDESHNLAWVTFDRMHEYAQEESVLRMNNKYLNFKA